MASGKPEADPIVALVDAKIAALMAYKDSYLKAKSLGALGQPGDIDVSASTITAPLGGNNVSAAFELPVGAFRNKSIPDAIKLLLAAGRRKQSVKDIATGLRQGGLESNARNFETTVTGSLHRLKADGAVLRFKDGWDLAGSYSEHIRKSLEKDSKPVRSGKTAKRPTSPGKKSKGSRAKVTTERSSGRARNRASKNPAPEQGKNSPTLDERIVTFLRVHPSQRYTAKQVADGLSETDMRIVGMAFARLARYGRVNKGDDGLYTSPRQPTEHLKAV